MKQALDFLSSVKVELQKVVWPTPHNTFKLTFIVILVTLSVGFFIGSIDFLLTKLLSLVVNK